MRCGALNRATAPILGAKVAPYGVAYGIHGQCGGKLHSHGRNVWIVMVDVCVCLVGEERERGGREKERGRERNREGDRKRERGGRRKR